MKYFIFTYGCQMNRSDSEKISTRFKELGYKPAKDAAEADLIAVNFCSVRQSAVHRALAQLDKYKNKCLIAAGCLLPADQKKLAAKNIALWHPDDYFSVAPLRQNKFSASVPIMTGCNNFCSYCAVPYTRGREKSRPVKAILAEIKKLLKNGTKEIILLGQNVNSYRDASSLRAPAVAGAKQSRDSAAVHEIAASPTRLAIALAKRAAPRNDGSINFPHLLQLINALPGDFWLSFISSHPKDLSDKMIEAMAKCKKITPYLHLPAQSGDDKVLRAMNRHYTVAHYKNLVKKIRASFKKYRRPWPPLAVSTDIIVGFPGETAKQFQNTLKLIKDVKFDMIYFARYSPRPGTTAAKLKDAVAPNAKMRRAQTINSLLKQQALSLNKKYINQESDVLIARTEGKFAFGKTITNKAIKLPRRNLKAGQFTRVKITSATAWHLEGE
ncbi:MiaB/RimO family radical SAM methylthiotransferase [Patescibacteria group bacterium]|nr:MiaB/RimO family radical SAM methylthiotransferase [Patescibacteria group bacterium]